jgi:type IV secretion system protein TrbL
VPTDPGMLTELLRIFLAVFTAGQARTIPEALSLLRWLAAIEIGLLALRYSLHRQVDIAGLIMLIFSTTVLAWIISQAAGLTAWLINSLIGIGLFIGGDAISVTDFTDPSMLVDYGFSITAVIFAHLKEYSGLGAVMNLPEVFLSGLTAWCVVIAYMVVGTWVFLILLGYYAATALMVILLPFAIFRVGAFVAEKAFGFVVAAAVQAAGVAMVTGVMLPILVRLQPGMDPSLYHCFRMLGGGIALVFVAVGAGYIGRSLTNGVPQLSLQDATRFAGNMMTTVTRVTQAATAMRAATTTTGRRR